MSRSPATASVAQSALRPYEESWEAIYNLIDEGAGWSGHERNCFFLNTRTTAFANVSAASGADFEDDGRALATTDWDFDGRLDAWVMNRTAPRLRLLRNASSAGAHWVSLRLRGTKSNRDAIGARVEITPSSGPPLIRTLRAGEGYLSQSGKAVLIGLGTDAGIAEVVVRWPGGGSERFTGVTADAHWTLVEGAGRAEKWLPPRGPIALPVGALEVPDRPSAARTWLAGRVLFPAESYRAWGGNSEPLPVRTGRPLLINLWSSTCGPCLEELAEWKAEAESLRRAGVEVLALCVDEEGSEAGRASAARAAGMGFPTGLATPEVTLAMETVSRAFLESRRPLPVPTSLLLDADGLTAALYKGRLTSAQLIKDAALLHATAEAQREAALPFLGRWMTPPLAANPRQIVGTLMKAAQVEPARAYTRRCLDPSSPLRLSGPTQASLTLFLGDLDLDAGALDAAVAIYDRLFELAPRDPAIHREVAIRLVTKQRVPEALRHLELAVRLDPTHADSRLNLAALQLRQGRADMALENLLELVHQRPDSGSLRIQVARILESQGRAADAVAQYEAAVRLQPDSPASIALAWLLATHPDATLRDGSRAVELAERAARGAGANDLRTIEVLAAAYAEVGRFDDAVAVAQRAGAQASAAGDAEGGARIERMLQEFRANRPVRMSVGR